MIREAGIDWTEVEHLMRDRKGWKEKMAERMSIWTGRKGRRGMGIGGNRERRGW